MSEPHNTTLNVNITSSTVFRGIAAVLALILAYYLRDLILLFLTSIVIGSAIEPLVSWLTGKKIPRPVSVVIIYAALFITIFILISIFLPLIFDDFFKLFDTIPAYIKSFNIFNYISDAPAKILDSIKNSIAEGFSMDKLIPGFRDILSGTSTNIIDGAKFVLTGLTSFLFIFIFSFYLAVQEKGIETFIKIVTPLKYEHYVLDLWTRSKRKIGYWMQGQILLGVLMGVFVFLLLSIIGIRNALALAVFASIFEIIPVFGPILAAIPAVIITFMQTPALGFPVLGIYVIAQQFESNLIYPLVVRKIVGMPPLISILFLIIGAKLAGLLGVILAIPTAVVILELIEDFEKKKRFVQPSAK